MGLFQMKNCSSPKIVRRGFKKKKNRIRLINGEKRQKRGRQKEDGEDPQKNVKYSIERCGKSTPFSSLKGKDPVQNARFQVGYRAF